MPRLKILKICQVAKVQKKMKSKNILMWKDFFH